MRICAYETKCMSLQHALLVSLAEREASGYDLTRRFDRSLGFFWSATHQQIYRVLAKMADAGLVEVRTEAGDGRPDRRVYTIAPAGRAELLAWTRTPTPSETLRSEFAVKVRGMRFGDADAVVADIRRHRDEHAAQLAYFEANCARHYPDPSSLSDEERPTYAVLRGGIRTERAMLEWCDEMVALLSGETLPTSCVQVHPGAPARRGEDGDEDGNLNVDVDGNLAASVAVDDRPHGVKDRPHDNERTPAPGRTR